jgi:hypothetical protein
MEYFRFTYRQMLPAGRDRTTQPAAAKTAVNVAKNTCTKTASTSVPQENQPDEQVEAFD